MKKIFRKNQIIVTTLAFMIAVAGYLSYSEKNINKKTTQMETTAETKEAASEDAGEAVLVNGQTFAAQAKLNREQVRAKNKEALLKIIDNNELGENAKADAISKMVKLTENSEKESAIETMLAAKGFENSVVTIADEKADVTVAMPNITEAQRAQIEDVVKRKGNFEAKNIVITPMSQAEQVTEKEEETEMKEEKTEENSEKNNTSEEAETETK